MKKYIIAIVLLVAFGAQAQEVSTLYFLENAPMRHLVNPAFQPVSKGYLNFTPLGYMSMSAGNNSLTLTDLIYVAPNGQTVTAFHPQYGNRDLLLKSMKDPITFRENLNLNWISFGFRIKEKGYFTFQVSSKIEAIESVPKGVVSFFAESTPVSSTNPMNINLNALNVGVQVYSEIAGGYSHKINDIWTVGGKLKILLGTANIGVDLKKFELKGNTEKLSLNGQANILAAAPLANVALPETITMNSEDYGSIVENIGESITSDIFQVIKPAGYGAAIDLGFTATPLKQLQISVALNDLGFIHWGSARAYSASIDTSFTGVGPFDYSDFMKGGQFVSDSLVSAINKQMQGYTDAIKIGGFSNSFNRMITTKLNVGIDGRFFNNRLSVGVLSRTMLYNGHLSEEVTFGLAGKPANWFNIAASYSLIENGKFSNIGAGLSFMPYDGINMTLAMDYIPLYYAQILGANVLPSRSKGLNIALGFSIVWGTNKKKEKQPELEPELEYKPIQLEMDKPVVSDVALANVEAEKVQEIAKNDRDNDGVVDWEDECPDLAGPAFNKGCPEIKKELRSLLKKAMQGIQFETGKDVILPSSFAILNRIAVQFIEHPEYVIEVQGHSDNSGKYEANVDLSQRRAEAVKEFLINAGVPDNQLTAKGYGPDRPIADNETKAGRALNRRVEFDIAFEQVQVQTIYEHADSVSVETLPIK